MGSWTLVCLAGRSSFTPPLKWHLCREAARSCPGKGPDVPSPLAPPPARLAPPLVRLLRQRVRSFVPLPRPCNPATRRSLPEVKALRLQIRILRSRALGTLSDPQTLQGCGRKGSPPGPRLSGDDSRKSIAATPPSTVAREARPSARSPHHQTSAWEITAGRMTRIL